MVDILIILAIIAVILIFIQYDLPQKITDRIYRLNISETLKYVLMLGFLGLQIGVPLYGFYRILMLF
ncbi:MAG: hypothetical protein KDE26_30075 [Bacteroidetes bacterium]|nr:hypothetical protein [Bacteroidota bacterium]MCB0847551.1 hypothetical protein [Bacteroidota bacterium]